MQPMRLIGSVIIIIIFFNSLRLKFIIFSLVRVVFSSVAYFLF